MLKFSPSPSAVRRRMLALPKMTNEAVFALRQRDADGLILRWRSGIVNRSFNLTPLKRKTVKAKARRGERLPDVPLYGLGLEGPWTYIKALRKYKTKTGWVVKFSRRMHHSGLTEEDFFRVHEYGAVIKAVNGTVFRIPARPAFTRAYAATVRAMRDDSELVLRAAWEHVNSGRRQTYERIRANARKLEAMLGDAD